MSASRAANTQVSDDESDVPEVLPLSLSKEQAKRLNAARQEAESESKKRRKERNRQIDAKLKRRALETRGSGGLSRKARNAAASNAEDEIPNESDKETRNLEARMERAMQEAMEEDNEEEESRGGIGEGADMENNVEKQHNADELPSNDGASQEESESGGEDASSNELTDSKSDDDDSSSSDELPKDPRVHYLPDHLFSEALSRTPERPKQDTTSLEPSGKTKSEQKRKQAKRKRRSPKDIIVGSKTIRTIAPKTTHISSAASRTLPPGKVKRFYEDRLNLRSNHAGKSHGVSHRRAANIGIMRSSTLPALNFVRNS